MVTRREKKIKITIIRKEKKKKEKLTGIVI